jgi:hypothetical protein
MCDCVAGGAPHEKENEKRTYLSATYPTKVLAQRLYSFVLPSLQTFGSFRPGTAARDEYTSNEIGVNGTQLMLHGF